MTDYLDEIQARADAATDGPWSCLMSDSTVVNPTAWWMTYPDPDTGASGRFDWPQIVADAAFIDHARTDVPRLAAALRAVEAAARETPPEEVLSSPEAAWVQGYNAAFTDIRTAIRDALEAAS